MGSVATNVRGRWRKALERALARAVNGEVDYGLDRVADAVVAAAIAGDKDAWREIGDRMDGKAGHLVTVGGEASAPLTFTWKHETS